MKKIILSAIVMAFMTVSCNQKTKEVNSTNSEMMENDSTTMKNDSSMMNNGSSKKMMVEKMYSCPMHPEVQGKLNDKCSKCGMKLTEPVADNAAE
ncbi:heavy metal-binding domain-containing protein [Flavobacterium sp.]|uniref:heavy metal-binding domain-containing protein n=1 Tax=Flavobacterium sp. TaxID=239 RepID=UPI003753C99C